MAATIKDVAEFAGVGIGTVSRVINEEKSVKPATREKVKSAMTTLQFSPNKMAAKLRKNETRIIALLVPVINHPFFAKFAYYVEDEADKFGYSTILVSSQQRVQKETDIIDRIHRREVDGAVFVTHFSHGEEELKDCPIVSIDRHFGDDMPFVTSDNYSATCRAVEYLLEKGFKNIGYIGSKPVVFSEVMERERAYRDTMDKHNLPVKAVNEIILHGEEQNVARDFLDKYPDIDGAFASGYSLAQSLYGELLRRGKRIPEDVQIVSYDGAFSQWNDRGMTCVEQPVEEMAREVVRILIKKIKGENVEVRTELKTTFVKGATTK